MIRSSTPSRSDNAAYLELAARRKAPLATLDKTLIAAAKQANIPFFEG